MAKLSDEIKSAKARGLMLAEIADLLGKGGMEVSETSIKRAIATPKKTAEA
ncbi:MAG: hypothetical protein WBK19_11005 [Azonexus sp.]